MSRYLYRLGRFASIHRWPVIIAWVLILGLVGTLAASLSRPMNNEFDMPGSRFQVVLDDLMEQIPEVAGATGTVVFVTDDGFDEADEEAVGQLLEDWQNTDGVATVVNPFASQDEVTAAQDEIDAGREEIDAGRAEADAGQAEIDAGREELDAGQVELDAAQDELDAERAEFEAGADALPPEQAEAIERELDAGQAEIDAGREEAEAGRAEVDAGQADIDAGREELDAAEDEVAVGERLLDLSSGVEMVSEDGTVALAQVIFVDDASRIDPAIPEEVVNQGEAWRGDHDGIQVEFSQEFSMDISSIMGPAEVIGVGVAAIVLFVMLGTFLAAGLPLLMALTGVAVGVGGAMAVTHWVEMNSVTPALALMLGLAVGIDYSLFLINRHRTQLRAGMPVRDSIALATGTSGNAVTFAGLTVIIALSALVATGIPFLGIMGLVAAATVLVAVLVSVTLTPALLSLLGERVLPKRKRQAPQHEEGKTNWAARVQRRPILVTVGVLALTVAALIPTMDLRLGLPDGSSEPADSSAYQAYDAVRENFGEGMNGPLIAVATLDEAPGDELAVQEAQADIGEDLLQIDGVVHAVPFGVSEDTTTLAFQIMPENGPADEATEALVDTLQSEAGAIGDRHDAELGFTGQTVANIDISQQLADALPLYLSIVVGLSLLLLIVVFRSILVPVLATVGFLVTLVTAIGATVAVYQWGWLGGLFGVHEAGPVLAFLPTLLVGVLFGLAMDYQLFLVSAMREAKVHGQSARDAIVNGFSLTARVVTAAAIIMVSVFGGFIFAHLTMIRPIGFGLAIGVLVDAFIVRMTLTPAVLTLLGDKAWWIPKWLDRILPDVDVEGSTLERELDLPGEVVDAIAPPERSDSPDGDSADVTTDGAPPEEPTRSSSD